MSFSVFPNGGVDTFTYIQDLSATDILNVATYKSLITLSATQALTTDQQTQVNTIASSLRYKGIQTADINKLFDAIISTQTFTQTTLTNYFKYCGIYNSLTNYLIYNSVTYNGCSFISLKNQIGVTPIDDGINWKQNSSNGATYALNIIGTVGTIIYNADGLSPLPAMSPFSCKLYENGIQVTPTSYSWTTPSSNTMLSGSSISATFIPTITSSFNALYGNNVVTLTATYANQTFVQYFPISMSKTGNTGSTGASGTGLSFMGTFDIGGTYNVSQAVEYQGSLYACNVNGTTGIVPTTTPTWSTVVSKGSSTTIAVLKNTVTVTTSVSSITIGISGYNPNQDMLSVYYDNLYIEVGTGYTISSDGLSINTVGANWDGTVTPITFNFVVLKNVVSGVTYSDGSLITSGSILISSLHAEIQTAINKVGTDTLTTTAQNLSGAVNENTNNITSNSNKISALTTEGVESTGYGVISGLTVTAQSTPDMTVNVATGIVHMANGVRLAPIGNSALAINASDVTNPRIDIVYVDSTGAIGYIAGTPSSSPVAPSTPAGAFLLEQISVGANVTTITNANLTDMRKIKNTTDSVASNLTTTNTNVATNTTAITTKLDKNGGTLQNYSEVTTSNAVATGAVTLDITNGNIFNLTLTGATTLTFTTPVASGKECSFTLYINQGTTAYSVTFPSSLKWDNDSIPDLSAVSKTNIMVFTTINGGTRWYGRLAMGNLVT